MRWTGNLYPFIVPEGATYGKVEQILKTAHSFIQYNLTGDPLGPFGRRYFNIGLELMFIFLLCFSVALVIGTLTVHLPDKVIKWASYFLLQKWTWLIKCWLVPNVLLVFGILPISLLMACVESYSAYGVVLALAGLRIFSVIVVYMFKVTLEFRIKEDSRLKGRFALATEHNRYSWIIFLKTQHFYRFFIYWLLFTNLEYNLVCTRSKKLYWRIKWIVAII